MKSKIRKIKNKIRTYYKLTNCLLLNKGPVYWALRKGLLAVRTTRLVRAVRGFRRLGRPVSSRNLDQITNFNFRAGTEPKYKKGSIPKRCGRFTQLAPRSYKRGCPISILPNPKPKSKFQEVQHTVLMSSDAARRCVWVCRGGDVSQSNDPDAEHTRELQRRLANLHKDLKVCWN